MNQIPEGLFSFFYITIAPFVDSIIGPDVATTPANPLCSPLGGGGGSILVL